MDIKAFSRSKAFTLKFGSEAAIIFAMAVLISAAFASAAYAADRDIKPEIIGQAPVYSYEVIESYPHDDGAFTEGLCFHEGFMYEGTGLYGKSSVRKIDLNTGKILKEFYIPDHHFGEGIVIWRDMIVQLTWRSRQGFVYGIENFTEIRDFRYPTEGWGITSDGERLIMSDGTDALYILDPETFNITGKLEVKSSGIPIRDLNELEYIKGEIYANVWHTDWIAMISPKTGNVTGWINLEGLLNAEDRSSKTDVLNGIAYDPEGDKLFVTGKFWPKLFSIKVIEDKS